MKILFTHVELCIKYTIDFVFRNKFLSLLKILTKAIRQLDRFTEQ